MGSYFESFYEYLVGRDLGDEVTRLIARRWPKTFDLLLRGCGADGWPALIRLTTSAHQWAVVLPHVVTSNGAEVQLSGNDAKRLLDGTMQSLEELLQAQQILPELVYILGGDDHIARKLKHAASLFNDVADKMSDRSDVVSVQKQIRGAPAS